MTTILTALFAGLVFAAPADRFYANADFQRQAPAAFAVQKEALPAVQAIAREAAAERGRFLSLLRAQPRLIQDILRFDALDEAARDRVLREVFAVEIRSFGVTPPALIIENDRIPGPAYFDFDPGKPGAGTVILNPRELAKLKSPFESLLLLIHETRHSAQFQRAFRDNGPAARGYRASFEAQKALKGFSFCDFMTLLNEYEAFQFANFVLGSLMGFRLDVADMGSFASQYDSAGRLKIDLLQIAATEGPDRVLIRFNDLEKAQARQLGLP